MKKLAIAALAVAAIAIPAVAGDGFDQFGYNYNARIFVGTADGVNRILGDNDLGVWGNDHLVMKWSKAWNDARFNGKPWTRDAWCSNQWNGSGPGGSGDSETVKIIWVGPDLENSPYWVDGGYAIWGQFEVILDHYHGKNGHFWFAHATPAGYGGK